jgi:hypothetical protein
MIEDKKNPEFREEIQSGFREKVESSLTFFEFYMNLH